jgi:hypothetical protein
VLHMEHAARDLLPVPTGDDEPLSWVPGTPSLFPPGLVPILREQLGTWHPFSAIADHVFCELVTVVYFAGLETHEGTHYPVRVAFAGHLTADVLLPNGEVPSTTPMLLYRWSTLRLSPDRAYCVSELAKLAVVTQDERSFAKVNLTDRGLRVVGLAREGQNEEGDPYLKLISPRPGMLSIRSGRESLVEYDRGSLDHGAKDVFTAPGRVRRALESAAQRAGLGEGAMDDYVATVRSVVSEMAAHGRGGILVISGDTHPDLPARASYRTPEGSSIAELLRYLTTASGHDKSPRGLRISLGPPAVQLRRVLQGAFVREVERWVTQLGAFTAMDGATVLDCGLGIRGFGVVLPVVRDLAVVEARDVEAREMGRYHLSTRGTRHRAAATYASHSPGSVVFVASHDGPLSCMLGDPGTSRVLVWRLGSGELL